jgi:arsenate reductase-like glutaredoxin family protein
MITLVGLSTCDSCKKARKALEAAGHQVAFRDLRAEPLSAAEWEDLVTELGSDLVNRKSTTWRGLSDFLRESEPEAQLLAQPTLMKRPLLRDGAKMTLGWDAEVAAAWGAQA